MNIRTHLLLVALVLSAAVAAHAEDKAIPEIGPVDDVQELHTGLGFTEGPADDGQGNIYR